MSPHSWTKWSAIAEVLSSVAILVTLVYLTIQTRQNASAIQAGTQQTMLLADLAVLQLASNGHLLAKDQLSAEEMDELQTYLVALVRSREFEWFQYRDGRLNRELWESYPGALGGNLSWPRTRAWWKNFSEGSLDPEFVEEVNQYLSMIPFHEDLRHNLEIIQQELR